MSDFRPFWRCSLEYKEEEDEERWDVVGWRNVVVASADGVVVVAVLVDDGVVVAVVHVSGFVEEGVAVVYVAADAADAAFSVVTCPVRHHDDLGPGLFFASLWSSSSSSSPSSSSSSSFLSSSSLLSFSSPFLLT